MTTIVCPQCQKDDMIQKVSALYSGGISKTQYQGYVPPPPKSDLPPLPATREAISQTALSRKLAPPFKPSPPGTSGWWGAGVVAAIGLCALFGITPAIVNPSERTQGFLVSLAILGFAVALFVGASRAYSKGKAQFESGAVRWNRAMSIWNELYYCARNDCIFVPSTGVSVPIDRIGELLYP